MVLDEERYFLLRNNFILIFFFKYIYILFDRRCRIGRIEVERGEEKRERNESME